MEIKGEKRKQRRRQGHAIRLVEDQRCAMAVTIIIIIFFLFAYCVFFTFQPHIASQQGCSQRILKFVDPWRAPSYYTLVVAPSFLARCSAI
jgi:cell division protein FtsW (lipid II flippase)